MFDTTQSYCLWSDETGCTYADPVFTWTSVVIVSLVVAIFTAVFLVPMELCFDYLSAPTADSIKLRQRHSKLLSKLQTAGGRVANMGRRMSNAMGRRMSNAVGRMGAAFVSKRSSDRDTEQCKVGFEFRELPEATSDAHFFAAVSLPFIQHSFEVVSKRQNDIRNDVIELTNRHNDIQNESEDELSSSEGDSDEDVSSNDNRYELGSSKNVSSAGDMVSIQIRDAFTAMRIFVYSARFFTHLN